MKLIQVQSGVQPQIQIFSLAVGNDHVDLGLEYSQRTRHVFDQAGLAGAQEEDGVDVVGVHQDPQLLGDLSRVLVLLGLLTVQIHPQRLRHKKLTMHTDMQENTCARLRDSHTGTHEIHAT